MNVSKQKYQAQYRYSKTKKGKRAQKRYYQSEKWKAAWERYLQRKISDLELIAFIQEKGVTTISEIKERFNYGIPLLSSKLTNLINKGVIPKPITLKGGVPRGSTKGDLINLFNGMACAPRKPRNYYYVQENEIATYIINKLNINPNLPQYHKKRLTQRLRRCLPPKIFKKVYEAYKS